VPGTLSEDNWSYRMAMDIEALLADEASAARLSALAAETDRAAP
jgi:4-alpha-glucanotransferase